MITADLAKKYGRKIFAIPGPITSEVSQGTLKLIKEGAQVATCAKDILDYYRSDSKFSFTQKISSPHSPDPASPLEKRIIDELKCEPLDADSLARNLKVSASELGSKLSLMQIKGVIQLEGNKYYVD